MNIDNFINYDGVRDFLDDTSNWPEVPNADVEEDYTDRLDLENLDVLSVDKEKLVIVAGGDWQEPHLVTIDLKENKVTEVVIYEY